MYFSSVNYLILLIFSPLNKTFVFTKTSTWVLKHLGSVFIAATTYLG